MVQNYKVDIEVIEKQESNLNNVLKMLVVVEDDIIVVDLVHIKIVIVNDVKRKGLFKALYRITKVLS